jgi:hypothetical protein
VTEEQKQEAAELAKRARGQSKAAAKNGARAVKTVAEPVIDAVHEEAVDTVNKLEGTADDAIRTARTINPRVLSRISGDTGQGFIALSVAIWAGTIAVNKFRGAYAGRNAVMTARATKPID